jgi:hypothetical protein
MATDYFPFPESTSFQSNVKCICGFSFCKSIIKEFREINDVRGHLKVFPNPRINSQKKKNTETDLRYKSRAITHFPQLRETLENQCNIMPLKTTRTTKIQVKSAYIAQWHFPKRLFELKADGSSRLINGTTLPKTMKIGEAESLGLYFRLGGSTYSGADSVISSHTDKEDSIFLLPTVTDESKIRADLEKAEKLKEASDAIAVTLHSRQNRQSSSKRPSDGASQGCVNDVSPGKRVRIQSKEPSFMPINEWNKLRMKEKRLHIINLQKTISKAFREKQIFIERENDKMAKINELESKIEVLETAIRQQNQLHMQNQEASIQVNQISESLLSNEQLLQCQLEVLQSHGLNRISIARKKIYKENKKLCNSLFGCNDFEFLIDFIEAMFDIKYVEPIDASVKRGGKNAEGRGLSEVEQVLLTILWTNTFWNYDVIGMIFGVKSNRLVGEYVKYWMPRLGEVGDMMSSLLPYVDSDVLKALEPESYENMELHNVVAALVDGKDFNVETVRADRLLNCAQASNKTHGSAFRILTWSLPCGVVVERTPAFFGRASEKALMRTWGGLGRLMFPYGYCILGDKGFDNTAGCYENYNTTLHPAFLTNEQFSRDQVNHNIKICQKRYSCEVVYARVTETVKLSGVFRREWFHHFEQLVGWAHGRANVFYGFLQPP